MQRTKLRLILDYPFFGSLALTMELIEDPAAGTVKTNGKEIRYNPEFTKQLTPDQKLFVYLHEICHIILGHSVRRGSRDHRLWNIAGDHAVNLLLSSSTNLATPPGALKDPAYENWSSERIYETLADEFQQEAREYDEEPDTQGQQTFREMVQASEQFGTVEDSPAESGLTEGDIQSAAALVERITTATGHDPGDAIRNLVATFVDTRISWKDLLSRFMCEACASRYNWMRPNRRYTGGGGVMLPSLLSNDSMTIAVAIDTSGSINDHLLNIFMSELKALIESIDYRQITIMGCSSAVFEPQTFQKGEEIDFTPVGGGSTAFAPVFEYVAAMDETPACLIYFTDLFSDKFGQPPGCPVLWIGDYGGGWEEAHNTRIPFGEIVNMHE